MIEIDFEVGRPLGLARGWSIDHSPAINSGPGLPLVPGRYEWRLQIGTEDRTEWRRFTVGQATGGGAAAMSVIDHIVRDGARWMLAEAVQAEVDAYIAQFTGERDAHGRRLVVRNGSHHPREVLTSAGAVEIIAPRVNDRRSDPTLVNACGFLGDPAALVP